MKNLCPPYKGAKIQDITQGYSDQHRAYDWASKFGTFLVAMENCIVENITDKEILYDNGWEYDRGFGILLRSISNPEIKYSYWHCLPFFPVKIGDIVLQGKPVARMGNSGYVLSNGQYVPLKDRLKPPYPGTHLHEGCPMDTLDRIDWDIPIKFDVLTALMLILNSMSNFLKK